MSYKTHTRGESRVFDHLYDINYITSDFKDVCKANNMALAKSAPLHIIPIYKTMFTDLTRECRNFFVLQQNPLPYYPYYGGGNGDHNRMGNVIGAERAKYFDVALMPKHKSVNLHLDIEDDDCCFMAKYHSPKEKHREIGCQTVYRESSAQTRPWMPNAIITERECETPEIVYVADLIKGDQLPGNFEAQIIECARKRREWEQKLPPIKSVKDWDKRRIILEAFEWEQWLARENEIHEYQGLRLKIVQKLMKKRESKMKELSNSKLTNTQIRIQAEKDAKLAKIRNNYNRSLRKLEMKHKKISKKYQQKDIVTEHIDKASDLYGPQQRFGSHPRQNHFSAYKTKFEARLEGLEKLDTKPQSVQKIIKIKDELWKPKEEVKEVQRGFWSDQFLKKLYESLIGFRQSKDVQKILPKCLEPISKSSSIGLITPARSDMDLYSDDEYQHVLFVQKLIKGRAIQNVLYRGRDKCRELITELQSTHELTAVNEMYPGQSNQLNKKRNQVLSHQKCHEEFIQGEAQVQEVLSQAEGSSIFYLLDFLSKELLRLQDQRKSHALYMLAEKERHRREAAEAGRRQIEEKRRMEHDEIFRNVIRANDDTATLYLENILMEGIEKISKNDSRERIKEIAREIDEAANNSAQENKSTENDENIISDLVNQFMIPEVYKRVARRNMQLKQQRHLLAAHTALFGEINMIPPIEHPIKSSHQISTSMIKQMIDDVVPSDTSMSNLLSDEDPAEHEADSTIRKILRKSFPSPIRAKKITRTTSAEETANTMITDLLSTVSTRARPKSVRPNMRRFFDSKSQLELKEIITDVNDRLLDYATEEEVNDIDDIEEESSDIDTD